MGIIGVEIVHVGGGRLENNVALAVGADAPAVKNHKDCFFCHSNKYPAEGGGDLVRVCLLFFVGFRCLEVLVEDDEIIEIRS